MNPTRFSPRQVLSDSVPVILVALFVLLFWEAIIWAGDLHRVLLPRPWDVAQQAWQERDALLLGCLVTGWAAILGLFCSFVLGAVIGILFSQFRFLRIGSFPYVMFLQTVPIIGIAPLLVTWSGYQFRTVIYVVMIISLFPIINGVTSGLLSTQPQWNALLQIYGAGRIQALIKLRIPAAVPYILVGLRTSGGLAVIGAIVGDFFIGFGGQHDGLGTLMLSWLNQQRTAALMAAMLASALVGLFVYGMVNLLSSTVLKRWNQPFDAS